MKTKSLVMTAAVAMAGAISSFAQVYSVNVVGYINLPIPLGYSMVANQLNASPDNKATNIFKAAPMDFAIFKYNALGGGFTILTYLGDGFWDPQDKDQMTLNPGEGCFVFNPTAAGVWTNTFVGEISATNSITIKNGYNIYGSPLPLAGAVDSALGVPIAMDDVIFTWNTTLKGYAIATSLGGPDWDGTPDGLAPQIAVGQAFWCYNPVGAKTWTKNYTP